MLERSAELAEASARGNGSACTDKGERLAASVLDAPPPRPGPLEARSGSAARRSAELDPRLTVSIPGRTPWVGIIHLRCHTGCHTAAPI